MTYDNGRPEYSVEEAPDGFAVCQNGMAMETPGKSPLVLPSAYLAELILEEALSRMGKRDPGRTPLTELALTAIDVIRPTRAEVIEQIMTFSETELLCHRVTEPRPLVKQQTKIWQPILDWAGKKFKAPLLVTSELTPIEQPPQSIAALHHVVNSLNDFYLVGLMQAVAASGSLILGLAFASQYLNAQQTYEAAELEINFQKEKWGDDPELSARHDAIRSELILCGRWFSALAQKKQPTKSGSYDAGAY